MKTRIIFVLAITILAGCKKDEQAKLVGRWTLSRTVTTAVANGIPYITKDSITTNTNYYLQLNDNKSGASNVSEFYYAYNAIIKGNFVYTYANSNLSLTYNVYNNYYAVGSVNKTVTWIDDKNIMLHYKSTDPYIAGQLEGKNPGQEGSTNSYITVDQYYSK